MRESERETGATNQDARQTQQPCSTGRVAFSAALNIGSGFETGSKYVHTSAILLCCALLSRHEAL